MTRLVDAALDAAGLVLQGVVATTGLTLPDEAGRFRQLLVFAHAGRRIWQASKVRADHDNRLDRFSEDLIVDFMERIGETDFQLLYPRDYFAVDLAQLGEQLGWQHRSPLGIGIHPEYGTWFAYRAVVAADTNFELTRESLPHPCRACPDKPCLQACPASALDETNFNFEACSDHRLQQDSTCASRCLARLACPVGSHYRYDDEQIHYHYKRSLAAIRAYQNVNPLES